MKRFRENDEKKTIGNIYLISLLCIKSDTYFLFRLVFLCVRHVAVRFRLFCLFYKAIEFRLSYVFHMIKSMSFVLWLSRQCDERDTESGIKRE